MSQPIWEPLNHEVHAKFAGQTILCRMMPYENKELGIGVSSWMELPTFNKYFTMIGEAPPSVTSSPAYDPTKTKAFQFLDDKLLPEYTSSVLVQWQKTQSSALSGVHHPNQGNFPAGGNYS